MYMGRYRARFINQLRQLSARDPGQIRHFGTARCLGGQRAGRKRRLGSPPDALRRTQRGPDHRFYTEDDQLAYLEVRSRKVLDHPELKSIDLNIVHDIGPFNGLAAIAGSVTDQSGAADPRSDR